MSMNTSGYTPDPRGFVSKYIIHRRNDDGTLGEVISGPTFTLRPYDPHARVAMVAYAASVANENKHLADDLLNLVGQHGGTNELSQIGLVEAAVEILIQSAKTFGAGKIAVYMDDESGEPISAVVAIVEPELVKRVKALIKQYDSECGQNMDVEPDNA